MITVNNFNHQKTIGVIGANQDAQAFILKANKLGFETYVLCETEAEAVLIYGADKVIVGDLKNVIIQDEFLMAIDFLVYYDATINAGNIEDIQRTVVIPQGNELLSIVQDRVLQKAFLDSLSVNIAPYATIVKPEDIKQGIRSIGYPAVLRTNQVNNEGSTQSYFIYDESDIEQATSLLRHGTCVLESWIVSEDDLSITAVKTGNGELKLFPIVKKEFRNDRLANVQVMFDIDEEVANEIQRVTHVILENIEFRGVVTIDFAVTPAKALYVVSMCPHPNILSRFSEQTCNISAAQAHLRTIALLPLPEKIQVDQPYLFVPFYQEQTNSINELLTIQPDWEFTFYPIVKIEGMISKEPIGHLVIQTDVSKKMLNYLKEKGL